MAGQQPPSGFGDGQVEIDIERKAILAGAGAVVVGAFLPWVSVLGRSVLGIQADGVFTLVLAAIGGGGAYYFDWNKRAMLVAAVAGGLVTLISLIDLTGFAAIGLYLTLAGGLALGGGGASGYNKYR
jgi:hypothetical protein